MATTITAIDPDFMSLEELAHRLDISLTVAYGLARRNALPVPALKIGSQYRFSRRAYEALADGRHGEPADDVA